MTVSVPGAEVTSYQLTGLQSSTEYEVQVAAENGEGTGPYSQAVTATTSGTAGLDGNHCSQACCKAFLRVIWLQYTAHGTP